ncbi:MAG: PAS domain-containing sensor histidine kinase [Gemmatimonadales bacterium]
MSSATPADSGNGHWTRLRPIIDSLADGIVIVDRGGQIRFANPAAARLFNRAATDLIGTPFGTPVVAGETTEMEIVQRGGGDVVHAELRVVDTDWEGDPVELVSLREITDRKRAEERARQLACEREARLEAEASSQAKSDFLAIMSHELRTPLNAILGYSELMELGISGDLTDSMRKQVGRIRVSAKHLLSLVNDILDLAKVEAGRLSVATVPSSVSEAVTSALTQIQPQAFAKNIDVALQSGLETLPSYVGDDERVRQILVNLLSNAVKSTAHGGKIGVDAALSESPGKARLQPRRSYVCIRIIDNGTGIPAEKLDAIFEPFVQAESGPTRSQEGSGLGLTIGRRLARAMGGDLTVVSEVGKGSTFSLWLAADVRVNSEHSSPGDNPDSAGQPSSSMKTIVNDNVEHQVRGLSEVANRVLAQLEPIVARIVGRIRSDPGIRMASSLRTSQIADHISTLIADMLSSLALIEEASGKPSQMLADAVEIQRLVSERHGTQRAKLGWTEVEMRREFMIIRDEVAQLVRQAVPPGGDLPVSTAVTALGRFVDQAEYVGVRSLERELGQ